MFNWPESDGNDDLSSIGSKSHADGENTRKCSSDLFAGISSYVTGLQLSLEFSLPPDELKRRLGSAPIGHESNITDEECMIFR